MLEYALMFFIVALIAGFIGLRNVAGMSAQIGYIFVVVAMVFILVSLVGGPHHLTLP